MGKLINFENLRKGMGVKIEGKYLAERFLAVEVSVRPPETTAIITGMIEEIDEANNSLRVYGRDIYLKEGLKIEDLRHNPIALNALKSKCIAKFKGTYFPREGFLAERIKMEETLTFNIDKMKGTIEKIDGQATTILVNGITVHFDAQTIIERD